MTYMSIFQIFSYSGKLR